MTIALVMLAAAQAADPAISGHWINPASTVVMQVARCGDAHCGTVRWASAKAQADARRGAPKLVGANLLTEVRATAQGRWAGKLFLPDRNIRITAKLELVGSEQLKVSGCAVGKSLCKSQLWRRTAEPVRATD